jgi:hypothetical protein
MIPAAVSFSLRFAGSSFLLGQASLSLVAQAGFPEGSAPDFAAPRTPIATSHKNPFNEKSRNEKLKKEK